MTALGADGKPSTVFVSLGPKPDEPGHLRGRETYPADVRARLAADADEIIARYPQSRSALLPLLQNAASSGNVVTSGANVT